MRHRLGQRLARYLARPRPGHSSLPAISPDDLGAVLQPGDVLLVEGTSRLSTAIKYLTQSTWSHAALYAGDRLGRCWTSCARAWATATTCATCST